MFYSYQNFFEKAVEYMNEKNYGQAKVEFEKALSAVSIKDRKNKKEIEQNLEICRNELSKQHFQYGLNLLESDEPIDSLDEFNNAMLLSVDSEDRKKMQKKIDEVE
ncbi:MAG: hypothetical protein M0Q02_12695, partial [Candidatus Muirbacterium halophilum]|nr:hypothetical protein [Candidatus Muirbacterium halophilum]